MRGPKCLHRCQVQHPVAKVLSTVPALMAADLSTTCDRPCLACRVFDGKKVLPSAGATALAKTRGASLARGACKHRAAVPREYGGPVGDHAPRAATRTVRGTCVEYSTQGRARASPA